MTARTTIDGDAVETTTTRNPFSTRLSLTTIVLSLLVTCLGSFTVGRYVRQGYMIMESSSSGIVESSSPSLFAFKLALPSPTLPEGKRKPDSVYSGKYFDTVGVSSRKTDVFLDDTDPPPPRYFNSSFDILATGEAKRNVEDGDNEDDEHENEDEVHQPRGQHLLVDIKNVDKDFLNSEEQLANATLSLISQSELTLLSYHCHGLEPMGVTCVGIILESHMSFHTWPVPGVITLDLFTCGSKAIMPLIPVIEKFFAVPQKSYSNNDKTTNNNSTTTRIHKPPRLMWALKKRGFDFSEAHWWARDDADHENVYLGWMEYDMKKLVAFEETPFQDFEVYDVIDSRVNKIDNYERSLLLSNDDDNDDDGSPSYESQHPELFQPDRVLFLSQVLQSSLLGLEAYHEALVHPAMTAHPEPKRVAIIGGGEGATLREVLKHNTVEKCIMVEIDGEMVEASRKHLPQWNDCSDLGFKGSCFDHPRAEVYFEDAIAWFINRFSDRDQIDEADKFDVIIMDALDPSTMVDFSDGLYENDAFAKALRNSLQDDGILAVQTGMANMPGEPSAAYNPHHKPLLTMRQLLQDAGFETIKSYDEAHGKFGAPWSFLVAFCNAQEQQVAWYANQAQIDLRLASRAVPTVSGDCPFYYFDGSTMQEYQYPSKLLQETFCKTEPIPQHCHEGRGFFDPEQRTVLESVQPSMLIAPDSLDFMKCMANSSSSTIVAVSGLWKSFEPLAHDHGFLTDFYGRQALLVDASIAKNHGCSDDTLLETSTHKSSAIFDPYMDRNHLVRMHYRNHHHVWRQDDDVPVIETELCPNNTTTITITPDDTCE